MTRIHSCRALSPALAMPKVVVVGAGIAGLACAQRLSTLGGCDVVVLEAAPRVGGRIKAAQVGGVAVDLGASWMHETRHNRLFRVALREKWPMRFTDVCVGQYTQDGPLPARAGIEPILRELQSMIVEDYHVDDDKPEGSLRDYVEAALRAMPLVSEEQKTLAALFARQIEHFIGQPWEDIPTSEGAEIASKGRDVFLLGAGYQAVVDYVRRETDTARVEYRLGEPVLACAEHDGRYTVTTAQGAYDADYVVCTLPLGVLKQHYKELFQFPLPQPLLNTITQTDLAHLGKVVVEFESVFWDTQLDAAFVVHTETQEPLTVVAPYADTPILVLLLSGSLVFELEAKPDTALERVHWAFEAIKTAKAVPRAVSVHVSDWSVNPLFLCSYSARALRQDYDSMLRPFMEGVGNFRFAGEHVALDGNGCVHAAYESGIREADYILNLENQADL